MSDDIKKQDDVIESEEEKKRLEDEEELEELDDELDEEEQKEHQESEEIVKLTSRAEGLEDQLKRAVADYRNLENRTRDERIEFVKYANKSLLEQLLPAFDTLLLAEKYTKDENFKIAVKHIIDILRGVGVEVIRVEGEKYNPQTMEAVEVVEGKEGEVVEVTQPGFTLNGKVIRPARVKVGGKE